MLSVWLAAATCALAPGMAERRGNSVLTRPLKQPVYSFAAVLRVPIVLGSGRNVIQPVGFGAGLQFRYHGLKIGRVRFGAEIVGGHIRVLERVRVTISTEDGGTRTITRYAALDQTSFALGPSVQAILGPVILELGGGVGVGINNLVRPLGASRAEEQQVNDVSAVARADGHLGIPIRRNQGVVLGLNFEKFFSSTRVVANLQDAMDPEAVPDVAPFDMVLSPYIGYQGWF